MLLLYLPDVVILDTEKNIMAGNHSSSSNSSNSTGEVASNSTDEVASRINFGAEEKAAEGETKKEGNKRNKRKATTCLPIKSSRRKIIKKAKGNTTLKLFNQMSFYTESYTVVQIYKNKEEF